MLLDAFRLMGTGVGMVFFVLAVFYGLVKALMVLLPAEQDGKD